MKFTALICGAALSLAATAGWAQQPAGSAPVRPIGITLERAVEIALDNNPTIRIADMEIQRQNYVRKETRGNLLPTVSGSGSYQYNIMNPVMFLPADIFGPGTGGAMRMGFDNSYTGGFSLSLPLYVPTLYKTLQLNDEQMRAAVESARASKVTLTAQVKKTCYGILLGESSLDVLKKNIEYARLIVETTENSFKQGIVSEYDLITAQVQLSNLAPTMIQIENSLKNARLLLNMLLSLPLDTPLELAEDLYGYTDYIDTDPSREIDLSRNTDLALLDAQAGILRKSYEIQRAQRIPTLAAMGSYQVLSQSNDWRIGHYQWKGTAFVGAQLSVPLFAGFTKNNKERQLLNSMDQLKVQRGYLEENVNVQARGALDDIFRSQEQMKANETALEQARKGYRIAKTRYDVGAGTIVELNSAQMALLQADLNYSQSIHDYMSAQTDFDQVLGKEEQGKL
ncbi:MAG: TolC family protein [Rikenellaceae bacterium]|jgi:outer membrane protein TolC|nr:TolC family protein [Rikenellaceae bacterium]